MSAVKDTDPVQLIRQLSETSIEVHLKNGMKYEETVPAAELDVAILELMGFREETMVLSCCAWPDSQDRLLKFKFTPTDLKKIGNQMLDRIFARTPYLQSKYVSLKVTAEEEKRTYYEYVYGSYEVEITLKFWCRTDMTRQIISHVRKENLEYGLCGLICDRTDPRRGKVSRNEIYVRFLNQDY